MNSDAKETDKLTIRTRVLCSILFLFFLYVGITFIINIERYNIYGLIFSEIVTLGFLSILFKPVFLGRQSYAFKKFNGLRTPEK